MNNAKVAEWLREAAGCIRESGEDYSQFLKWHNTRDELAKIADKMADRAAQVEAMTCDDEAVKEMAEALEGLLYRTEGISLQNKWDAGLMALQKYKASPKFGCIHWEKKP